jgi:hypothetical protein
MSADLPVAFKLPTIFYLEDGTELHRDKGYVPVANGMGFVWAGTGRFRVVDVWTSYDHHGRFEEGQHVFLAPVRADDDRLKHLAPDYFTK